MSGQPKRRVRAASIILTVVLIAGEWVLFVAGVKRNEMIVGLVCTVLASLFVYSVLSNEDMELNFSLRDVCTVWRVPWYILTNTFTLCSVLAKDVLGLERAGSYYRVSGFRTSKTDPTLVSRRVLATAYTTVSPNSIVIGIDYEQSRLLLHQVKRDEVSKMTKQLGGQT